MGRGEDSTVAAELLISPRSAERRATHRESFLSILRSSVRSESLTESELRALIRDAKEMGAIELQGELGEAALRFCQAEWEVEAEALAQKCGANLSEEFEARRYREWAGGELLSGTDLGSLRERFVGAVDWELEVKGAFVGPLTLYAAGEPAMAARPDQRAELAELLTGESANAGALRTLLILVSCQDDLYRLSGRISDDLQSLSEHSIDNVKLSFSRGELAEKLSERLAIPGAHCFGERLSWAEFSEEAEAWGREFVVEENLEAFYAYADGANRTQTLLQRWLDREFKGGSYAEFERCVSHLKRADVSVVMQMNSYQLESSAERRRSFLRKRLREIGLDRARS